MSLLTAKYICTKDNAIIVFASMLKHSDFKNFEPVSAGFICFGADDKHNPTCTCYGESVSLGLKAQKKDTKLAERQLLGKIF